MPVASRSLDAQHAEFVRQRFLAMPIAGTIAWLAIALAGLVLGPRQMTWVIYIATGSIFYLGILVAKLLGEDLLARERKGNWFDSQFMLGIVQAVLVYAIAIPFMQVQPDSLPMTVAILTGLMWVPFSGLIRHWIGLAHGVGRTVLVTLAWYAFPASRYVVVPAVVVACYLVTLVVLARRAAGLRGAVVGATA